MPSVFIATIGKNGPEEKRRYEVRARLGGRDSHTVRCGRFEYSRHGLKAARARAVWAEGEINANPPRIPDVKRLLTPPPKPRSVIEAVRAHHDTLVPPKPNERTIKSYGSLIENHIATSPLAKIPITEVTTSMVVEEIARLKRAGDLAPGTIRQIRGILQRAFDHHHDVVKDNPVRNPRVKTSAAPREARTMPTVAEIEATLRTIVPRYRFPLICLYDMGLRIGELLRVRVMDLDHGRRTVRLVDPEAEDGGKTEAGARWVTPSGWIFDELAMRAAMQEHPEALVFAGVKADSMRRALQRNAAEHGIKYHKPHSYRRRYISERIAEGVAGPLLSRDVGHARNSFTQDQYGLEVVDDYSGFDPRRVLQELEAA